MEVDHSGNAAAVAAPATGPNASSDEEISEDRSRTDTQAGTDGGAMTTGTAAAATPAPVAGTPAPVASTPAPAGSHPPLQTAVAAAAAQQQALASQQQQLLLGQLLQTHAAAAAVGPQAPGALSAQLSSQGLPLLLELLRIGARTSQEVACAHDICRIWTALHQSQVGAPRARRAGAAPAPPRRARHPSPGPRLRAP